MVCGGSIRGWLPDVAVILWKRMLGALGDVNQIVDPKLHAQVFEYLIKLTDTLIKIKKNQGVSLDNLSTPQASELVPPLTLILPWCFGALCLTDSYESGRLNALRLLITVMLNCDVKYRTCLPQFYCCIHTGKCEIYRVIWLYLAVTSLCIPSNWIFEKLYFFKLFVHCTSVFHKLFILEQM